MNIKFSSRLGALFSSAVVALGLTACQAERKAVEPVEPEWDYHEGEDPKQGNAAEWEDRAVRNVKLVKQMQHEQEGSDTPFSEP